MPRSPSPPPRGYRPSYRESSPPWSSREREDYRYRGESSRYREYDRRDNRDYRDVDRDRGPTGYYASGRDEYRDREYDRRRVTSPPTRSYSISSDYSPSKIPRHPNRSRSKSRSTSISRSRSRTGTPEEGQITSTSTTTDTNQKTSINPAGLPPRPRSPLPPTSRRRSRSPPPYRGYPRERERDWRDRERGYYDRRSRSPYSPPTSSYRRRRSPSIISSISTRSPSSRPSPSKRRYPSRSRSPPPPQKKIVSRIPSPVPTPAPPAITTQTPAPAPASTPNPTRPIPVAVPLGGTKHLNRMPPSAPRSERIPLGIPPTGPRALAHLNTPIARPLGLNRAGLAVTPSNPVVREEIKSVPLPSTPSDPAKLPIGPTSTPRLSWSERKTNVISPSSSTNINTPEPNKASASPTPTTPITAPPKNISSIPTTGVVINPYTGKPFGQARAQASISTVTSNTSQGNSSPIAGSTPNKTEDIKLNVINDEIRPPTPPVSTQIDNKPLIVETKSPLNLIPMINEEELVEQKRKEEEDKILAELPNLKVSYGGLSWETELDNHNYHLINLSNNTLRLQSASRHAAMILADAEAERIAAGERRKICENQLLSFSIGMGVGIISGV
ncbi:uncharacterized protein I206_100366 [Kwoniella pini CBS 10737]|uniref:Uncharacterized protein n=1 Tax=Kwoniella pini CBS 10737 TaxID=1296096 RepID=A0A1B9IDP5_9TREE|nr:uncharacterized protein I206_00959 [Kwoniella pini CBS 10737]OCF53653.1 hypothetical protein I206_00959 [Kwoniella pini CBS 10737]